MVLRVWLQIDGGSKRCIEPLRLIVVERLDQGHRDQRPPRRRSPVTHPLSTQPGPGEGPRCGSQQSVPGWSIAPPAPQDGGWTATRRGRMMSAHPDRPIVSGRSPRTFIGLEREAVHTRVAARRAPCGVPAVAGLGSCRVRPRSGRVELPTFQARGGHREQRPDRAQRDHRCSAALGCRCAGLGIDDGERRGAGVRDPCSRCRSPSSPWSGDASTRSSPRVPELGTSPGRREPRGVRRVVEGPCPAGSSAPCGTPIYPLRKTKG